MTVSKGLSPETVATIVEVGFTVALQLVEAFSRGDDAKVKRLASVVPDELKSKLALQLGIEKAQQELGGL